MAMNSRIYIAGLRLYAFHGVMPQERLVGGEFEVTISVDYDISRAMVSDDVTDTLSYADLCDLVKSEMAVPSNLLEHVAGRIARAVIDRWPQVDSVSLSITKLNPPMGADCNGAGVELHLINDKTQEH